MLIARHEKNTREENTAHTEKTLGAQKSVRENVAAGKHVHDRVSGEDELRAYEQIAFHFEIAQ